MAITTQRKTAVQVTGELRQRVANGHWQPGQMLPGRRALAVEHGVALATLERAVAVLLADGVLQADNGRGTFVMPRRSGPVVAAAPPTWRAATPRTRRLAVGILADCQQQHAPNQREAPWPEQMLTGCEHMLAGEPGLVQRFGNLRPPGAAGTDLVHAGRQMLAEGVDALLVIGQGDVGDLVALAQAAGCHVVCVNYDALDVPVPQVHLDSVASGALALAHLRERGYHHFTYLRALDSVWMAARLAGAQAAAGSGGLRIFPSTPPLPLSASSPQRRRGWEVGQALLAEGLVRGTGVIAPNDWMALGFMDAAREHGLTAGRDYGLVGFDDYGREAQLTSLRPPLEQMGREAASLVLRLLRGEDTPGRLALPHRLMARASTQGPAAAGSQRPA